MDDVPVAERVLEVVVMTAVIRPAVSDQAIVRLQGEHVAVAAPSLILGLLEVTGIHRDAPALVQKDEPIKRAYYLKILAPKLYSIKQKIAFVYRNLI